MHIRKTLLVAMMVVLPACATNPSIKVVTEKVYVPISQPCKEELPPVPDYCFVKLAPDDDIYVMSQCLLSDRKLSLGYEGELTAKLKSCRND